MNKIELQKLLAINSYPAVSILLPTHRSHPENQQDPIRVKNLVNQAIELLAAKSPRREVDYVIKKIEELVARIDYRYTQKGLAIFAHKDYSGIFYLPFPIRERVATDCSFVTRDIVFALNRSQRYWVLVLSEKPTRLYQGDRDTLEEITDGEFPMVHLGPGGAASLPGGFGIRRSAIRDEYDRKFFRHVDQAFSKYAAADPLPLILVGVERNLAFFMELTSHLPLLLDTLKGSHDSTSLSELVGLIWPIMEKGLAQERNAAFHSLEEAISKERFASGIRSVWSTAQQGRGALLLVEQNFHCPARLDENGLTLTSADDQKAPDVIEDAIDLIIDIILEKQGRVVFMDDGDLDDYGRVALVLRY